MKKFLMIAVMGLMAASLVLADPTCPTTPPGATWQNYMNLNSAVPPTCHIDGLDFSQFTFSSSATGGVTQPVPSDIGVTTLTSPPFPETGFEFNPGGFALQGPGKSIDATLDFVVTAAPGSAIDDLTIFFDGSFSGTGSGTKFTETYCSGPGFTTCNNFSVSNPGPGLSQHIILSAPVSALSITKDFGAHTGVLSDGCSTAANCQASISTVRNSFSTIPEPRLMSLLTLGLLAGLGLSKKFKSNLS
jgi:hypothetical protein